jgi:DNA uptake protein ComE-like DNA-binding protein
LRIALEATDMCRGALISRKLVRVAFAMLALALTVVGPSLAGTTDPKAAHPTVAATPHKPLLDLNKASVYDLEQLPGIGGAEAHKIIDNRPYRTKADLLSRKVLPTATYSQIAPLVMTNIHKVSGKPNC